MEIFLIMITSVRNNTYISWSNYGKLLCLEKLLGSDRGVLNLEKVYTMNKNVNEFWETRTFPKSFSC